MNHIGADDDVKAVRLETLLQRIACRVERRRLEPREIPEALARFLRECRRHVGEDVAHPRLRQSREDRRRRPTGPRAHLEDAQRPTGRHLRGRRHDRLGDRRIERTRHRSVAIDRLGVCGGSAGEQHLERIGLAAQQRRDLRADAPEQTPLGREVGMTLARERSAHRQDRRRRRHAALPTCRHSLAANRPRRASRACAAAGVAGVGRRPACRRARPRQNAPRPAAASRVCVAPHAPASPRSDRAPAGSGRNRRGPSRSPDARTLRRRRPARCPVPAGKSTPRPVRQRDGPPPARRPGRSVLRYRRLHPRC